jgi:hypothetical protein
LRERVVSAVASGQSCRAANNVGYYVVWHFFEHEGISFKKACAPASKVFVDETWAKTNMTRARMAVHREASGW